jgi:hypothetical protein
VFKYDVIGLETTVYRKILFDNLYQINFGAPDKEIFSLFYKLFITLFVDKRFYNNSAICDLNGAVR